MTATATPPRRSQEFWRMDDPVLDEHGAIVKGGMWEHQREWWDMPNYIRALVTGYGGGKTMSLAKRMIWLSLYNSPVPSMTVSPTYPMAEDTIVEAIDELLDGRCSLEERMTYKLVRSKPFRFAIDLNGREAGIVCYSGEKPKRLKGPNMGAAGIDEPFIQHADVFKQVIARVRHPMARRREINITGTPEGVVGWGYELCEGEDFEKQDVGLVQASTDQNRALPDDYVGNMEAAYDEAALAAYKDGQFVNMSQGRIYHSFDATIHVKDEEMPSGAELCVGMDFNVDPMAYLVFWRKGQRVHFVAEYEHFDSDAEQCASHIRNDHPTVRKIYADASGSQRSHAGGKGTSAHGYLRQGGYQVVCRPSNPAIVDRINAVNGGLRHGRVTVAPGCRKLRSYLLAATHKESRKESQKAMGHLLDAFGYPIAYLFPVDKQTAQHAVFRI